MFTSLRSVRRQQQGMGLIEVMVAASLFFLISLVFAGALTASQGIFRQGFSRDSALQQLMKAKAALCNDLKLASSSSTHLAIGQVPGSLPGSGADSDALIFLSPKDSDDSTALTTNNRPFWRRNILYYASVPTDYTSILGQSCSGGNTAGYDYNCPIKHLMRVELDQNLNDTPRISGNCDSLLPFGGLLSRPTGYPMSPSNFVVAANLLSFRCQLSGGQINFDLRAVAIADAKKEAGFGTQSWDSKPSTLQATFSVTPQNSP